MPSPTPPTKLPSGCYYKQDSASSKCAGPFLEWERDFWGEANANSGASEEDCMARKTGHDGYCGVTTEWRFVGGAETPAPEHEITTTAPFGDSSFRPEPYPCNWRNDLQFAVGATFEGATIRTDYGVSACQDCTQRCFFQIGDCVGIVYEPYSSGNRGKCTYFSRIGAVKTADTDDILALTTSARFGDLSISALLQLHDAGAQ